MTATSVEAAVNSVKAAYGADAELYRQSGEWTDQTIIDVFRSWAERRPDALAVGSVEGSLTFEQLDLRSDALALGLIESGLEPGSPMLFQMGNELETIVALYGVLKAGLVPVCSIPNHRLHEASLIAQASGAKGHIFQADYRGYDLGQLSVELAERCPDIGVRVVARGAPTNGALSLAEMVETADPKKAREIVDEVQKSRSSEDIAIFQLSGGTTGIPKVIPHTHATYLSVAARWSRNLGWTEKSVNLHFLPIMHHAGLGTVVMPTHFVGGTAVMARAVDAKLLVELIERYKVSWMHFNLAALRPLQEYTVQFDCDFSSLTHFMWANRSPSAAQVEEMLGATCVGSFGMGEGVHLAARPDDPVEIRHRSLGSVIGPHDEVIIRSPGTDEEVLDGEIGELTFKGPSVIRTYLSPEHSSAFTPDGFLRTGDLGRAHVLGDRRYFTLDGRLKDQISRGGEKFMAVELELLLQEHPDIREVAAFGLPDPGLGERVCVAVVMEPASAPVAPEDLRRRLVDHLDQRDVAKFKWPERLVIVEELPKTGIGKVLKDALRDQVMSQMENSEARSS